MNLTDKTIEIIKATAPVVEEKVEELTKSFYPILFSRYPAMKMFFNQTHLRDNTQPRAFAASIIDYANSIDNLDAIKTLVNEIAEKHASLNIKPVQYSIVIPCMLEAIGNVLGDVETPEIKNAWEEAMVNFSNIIIETESKRYDDTLVKEGGWKGYKNFTITQKENESALITSLYLEPADGKPVATYKAGQYISIMLDLPEEGIVFRNYSLSYSPNRKYYHFEKPGRKNNFR